MSKKLNSLNFKEGGKDFQELMAKSALRLG